MTRKSKNPTSSALMGAAFFQGLVALMGWTLYSPTHQFGFLDWLVTFSWVLFLILAIFAKFRRLPAALVGCVLYAAYLGYQALLSMQLLLIGFLLIKLPVILLLLYALISALRPAPAPSNNLKGT
jgi:hypothetical protein